MTIKDDLKLASTINAIALATSIIKTLGSKHRSGDTAAEDNQRDLAIALIDAHQTVIYYRDRTIDLEREKAAFAKLKDNL